jgi:hypothetical protein
METFMATTPGMAAREKALASLTLEKHVQTMKEKSAGRRSVRPKGAGSAWLT